MHDKFGLRIILPCCLLHKNITAKGIAMKTRILCKITPYNFIVGTQLFGETFCIPLQGIRLIRAGFKGEQISGLSYEVMNRNQLPLKWWFCNYRLVGVWKPCDGVSTSTKSWGLPGEMTLRAMPAVA
jgi:hypothetical protein